MNENETKDEDELVLENGEAKPAGYDASQDPAPREESEDQVTATRKFNWLDQENEQTRTYFPGQIIDDQAAAEWALDHQHGEQKGLQSPARSHVINAPNNAARSLDAEGGETKRKGGKGKR